MELVARAAAAGPAVAGTPPSAVAVHAPTTHSRLHRTWHAVESIPTISFKGGYTTKAEPVETTFFSVDGAAIAFVHVSKKLYWLQQMTGGSLKRAGKVMDDIREAYAMKLKQTYAEAEPAEPAVAGADEDEDPMLQCDGCSVGETPEPKRQRQRHRATKTPTKPTAKRSGNPLTLEMPLFSKSAQPKNPARKTVTVNVRGQRGKGELWILHSDIPWLLSYLADEVNTGSVIQEPAFAGESAVAGSSLDGPTPNCDVPGLRIRLSPVSGNLDEYEALFVDGPIRGTSVTSKVSTMSQAKWDKLQATASSWQCPCPDFSSPTVQRHHKVRAVIHLLELTMQKTLDEYNLADSRTHSLNRSR